MEDEGDSAKRVMEFYVDLIENNIAAVRYSLSENVVLDWFGKTVKDKKKVVAFLKDQVAKVTHHIDTTVAAEEVAFKEVHRVKVAKEAEGAATPAIAICQDMATPPRQTQASTSTEVGQGDGAHNNNNNNVMSPPKKLKLEQAEVTETLEGEAEAAVPPMKYLTAEGSVEFHKPSSKKLQSSTKWRRPAKLHLGYTAGSLTDCTIYLIIYEGNLKCRRNLLKDFCESERVSI